MANASTPVIQINEGNVGIGEASPSSKLVVAKNINPAITILDTTTIPAGTQNAGNNITFGTLQFQWGAESYSYMPSIEARFNETDASYGRKAGLDFKVGNIASVTAMSILSSGEVGIGYTSPDVKLVLEETPATIVNGNAINGSTMKGIKIRTNLNGDESVGLWFGTNGAHWSGISGQRKNAASTWGTTLSFYTHENTTGQDLTYARERMIIDSEGNVGIGTTSPDYQLDIENTSGAAVMRLHAAANNSASLRLKNDAVDWDVNCQTNDTFAIYNHTDGTERLVILPTSGNVGIGTASPAGKFNSYISAARQLTHNGNGGDLSIISDNNNNPVMFIKGTGTAALLDIQGTQGQLFSVTDDLSGSIFAVADISGVPIFDVNSSGVSYFDGNVGIGTDSPTTPLSIESSGADDFIKIENTATYTGLWMNDSGTNNGWLVLSGYTDAVSSGDFAIREYGVQTSLTIKQTTGNVGIGVTGPTRKLQVEGGASYPLSINSTQRYLQEFKRSGVSEWWFAVDGGSFIIHENGVGDKITIASGGTLTTTGDLVAYSDERLKSNIKTLDGSKVYDMRGVSFIKDNKKGSGVIAQEIQKIAPELVNDGSEYLGVAYGNISGYLIEAIKELKAEIEELKLNKCNCNK